MSYNVESIDKLRNIFHYVSYLSFCNEQEILYNLMIIISSMNYIHLLLVKTDSRSKELRK